MISNESREFKVLVLRILRLELYHIKIENPDLSDQIEILTKEIMEFVKGLNQLTRQDYESRM